MVAVEKLKWLKKKQGSYSRFEDKDGDSFGEYYIIGKNGNLDVYGRSGLVISLQPIK